MTVVILLLACFLGMPIDFKYVLPLYFTMFMVLMHVTILVCVYMRCVIDLINYYLSICLSNRLVVG